MARPMRMAELAERSGVSRETIHFYLREGLLPRPRKGGRTVAYYDEEHLERLRTIRRLREDKYLPLAVIKRLLEAPAAAAERDVDALAEVLHITGGEPDLPGPPPSQAAIVEARARGLLGARRAATQPEGAEQRVLALVDEALRLDPAARELTLADLAACAEDLSTLVGREAELFFDRVFASRDVTGTIAALRDGRGTVARFITAYRNLMLRRIVDDMLDAIERGRDVVARTATVPLSADKERELGMAERRAELAAAAPHDGGAALAYAWHLFACGATAELARLDAGILGLAGPPGGVLAAWGAFEQARSAATMLGLERAAVGAPELALGAILVGEALLARGVRRREGSVLEDAVPALHLVVSSDPAHEQDRAARAFGLFHRARIELALPSVLGRGRRGAAAMEQALALADEPASPVDPVGRARIGVNARLALARHHTALGDRTRARALLADAVAIDPAGPITAVAESERQS